MIEETNTEASRFNERTHRFISALLISMMMASAGLTVAQVGTQITPEWKGNHLVVIGFLASLECLFSHRSFKKLSVFSREWTVFTSTQWVINLIVVKLIVSLSHGLAALLAEMHLWQRAFAQKFFTPEYIGAVIFAILVWFFVGILVDCLDEMGLDKALILREAPSTVVRDQLPPRQRLMATVFGIGAVLTFMTAVSRVDLRTFFSTSSDFVTLKLSPLASGGAGTLFYFMFALALVSQSNYITLNTRWFLQRVPVSREIASRWAIYSIGFLVLVVLIASFLPTSYSLGLLSVLGYLLNILLGIIMFILGLIYIILGILISLPLLLFTRDTPIEIPQAPPARITVTPPVLTDPGASFPWLDFLKSLVFWIIFLGVIGYSVAQYIRQHEEILASLRKIPGWQILVKFWRWITGILGSLNRRVSTVIQAGRTRLRSRGDSVTLRGFSRFTRLRNLSPRQKVFFYYQAMLRRGEETGLPRGKSQTPDEYALRLERTLPTVEREVTSLTEAFSDARYSRHPVENEEANIVKAYWERIRRVFRGRRG